MAYLCFIVDIYVLTKTAFRLSYASRKVCTELFYGCKIYMMICYNYLYFIIPYFWIQLTFIIQPID